MFFVYAIDSGLLWSWTRSGEAVAPPEALAALGRAVVEVPDEQVPASWAWNPATLLPVALPPSPPPLSRLEMMRLFTMAERIGVRLSVDPVVIDFRDLMNVAQEILLDDPDTIAGVQYLEAQGLIGEGRAAEILGG